MNYIHTTNYKLYKPQIKRDFKIAVISDLHFSYNISEKKLQLIKDFLQSKNPEYILIAGDLIDSVDMIENNDEKMRLLYWLEDTGKICNTFISLGGHDFFQKSDDRSLGYNFDKDFYAEINNIPKISILDNQSFCDDIVNIVGITQSYEYYQPKNGKEEDKKKFLEDLHKLKNIINGLPKEKLNLAMIHSPMYLNDLDIKEKLKEFDYLISGHMHNGCVPPILYELWKSTRGFISPNKYLLFPKNERNTLKYNDDKLLVNGPLTMFHECSGSYQNFNFLFPIYMSFMEFTNDLNYDRKKIYIRRKYEKCQNK